MRKTFDTHHLSPEDAAALRATLEDGVERGCMKLSERDIQNISWRYQSDRGEVIVQCYNLNQRKKKKKHSVVVEYFENLGPLVLDGRWEEFEESLGGRREQRKAGWLHGPLSLLRVVKGGVVKADESETPRHATTIRARSDLSDHQREIYDRLIAWAHSVAGVEGAEGDVRAEGGVSPVLTLGGYAGTGKSTLVATLAAELGDRRIEFCAPTGRAALVLRQKLRDAGIDLSRHGCGTIHRLIYSPQIEKRTGRYLGVELAEDLDCDLLIVDEASMVSEKMYKDLREFGIPILAVGDHGQLPPIQGRLNLMKSPDLRLEEIHRQAAGSPIVQLSAAVRAGADPMTAVDPRDDAVRGLLRVRVKTRAQIEELLRDVYKTPEDAWDTAILCYTNKTRVWFNDVVRGILQLDEDVLSPRDVVVCLRSAYFEQQLLANGIRGIVDDVIDVSDEHHVHAMVSHPDDGYIVDAKMLQQQFRRSRGTIDAYNELGFKVKSWADVGLLYDHGYALTVHKAQGSQFRRVVLILEQLPQVDAESWRRWLYTGVTRAAEELILVESVRS